MDQLIAFRNRVLSTGPLMRFLTDTSPSTTKPSHLASTYAAPNTTTSQPSYPFTHTDAVLVSRALKSSTYDSNYEFGDPSGSKDTASAFLSMSASSASTSCPNAMTTKTTTMTRVMLERELPKQFIRTAELSWLLVPIMDVDEYVVGLMWSKSGGKGQAHGNMIGTAVPMEEEMIMHTCAKAHSVHPRNQPYHEREREGPKAPTYSSKAQPITSKFAVVANSTTYPMWVEAHVLPLGGYILETRIYVPSGILCKELREVLYFKMPTLVYTAPSMAHLAHAAYFEEQLPCAFCARTKSQDVLENEYDQLERDEQEQASFALFQPCACQCALFPNGSQYKIPDVQALRQYCSKHSVAYRWRQFMKWAFQGFLFRPFHQSIVYAMETGARPLRSDACDTSKLPKTKMHIQQMFIRTGSTLLTELKEDFGKQWVGYLPVPEPQSEPEPLVDQQTGKRQQQHQEHQPAGSHETHGAGGNPPLASASPQHNGSKAVSKKMTAKGSAAGPHAGAGNKKMSPKSKHVSSPTSSMENGKGGKKVHANAHGNSKLGKKGKKMMVKKRKSAEGPVAPIQGAMSKKQRTTSKSSLGNSAVAALLPTCTAEAAAGDGANRDFNSPLSLDNGVTSKSVANVDIAISKKSSVNSVHATAVDLSSKKGSTAFEVVRDSSISSVAS